MICTVWKCSKCKKRTRSYSAMMKHFYREHYQGKAKSEPKGKQKKVFTFRPPKRSK